MKRHLLCAVAVATAVFGLSGVSAHAQDVTDTSTDTSSAQTVFVAPSAPAAAPAPRPRSFLSDDGKVSIFVGYSFLNTTLTEGNDGEGDCNAICYGRDEGHGFAVQGTYFLNPNFGLTADFSGHYGGVTNNDDGDHYHLPQNSYYILFGPTVAKRVGKVVLSAHALVGVARLWAAEDYIAPGGMAYREDMLPWNTGFALGVGGSADWMFSSKVGWRVAQVDYLWSDAAQSDESSYPNTEHVGLAAVRFSTGIVFNFGGMR